MKKILLVTTVLCAACFPTRSFSAPMRPIGPVTIEGAIKKISWHAERRIKGIPRMSGSAGHDRTMPAHYRITLTATVVTVAKHAKSYCPYKTGDTINIKLNHPTDDNFLKQDMKVRIIDFSMKGDEGGVQTSFKKIVMLTSLAQGDKRTGQARGKTAYLFSSFRGNGEDGVHLAYSHDGLKWTALKGDKAFLKPKVGGKLMRDPCIIQGPDGRFHMVWTTSWRDKGIGIAHSKDLIEWSEQEFVPVMKHEPKARNCWAPEITWDPDGEQYVIYWATTIPGRFQETAKGGDRGWNHRIYSTTTKDFKNYTKAKLFYEPGFNVIDSTIFKNGDQYIMILKEETRQPPAKNLRVAYSKKVTGPWGAASAAFTPKGIWVEGPTCLKVGKWTIVYYDEYRRHKYGAMRTTDFKTWEDISDKISFPKGTRHGTALAVSNDVLKKLLKQK